MKHLKVLMLVAALATPVAGFLYAQASAVADWQIAAGGKMTFEVASVKRGAFVPPSFPLDVGDAMTPTGGRVPRPRFKAKQQSNQGPVPPDDAVTARRSLQSRSSFR